MGIIATGSITNIIMTGSTENTKITSAIMTILTTIVGNANTSIIVNSFP